MPNFFDLSSRERAIHDNKERRSLDQIRYLSSRISTLKNIIWTFLANDDRCRSREFLDKARAEVHRFDGLRDLILSQEPAPPGLKHDLFDEIVDNIVRGEQ